METIGGVLGVFGHDGSYDGTDEAGGDDLTLGMGIGFILMLPMRLLLRRRRRRLLGLFDAVFPAGVGRAGGDNGRAAENAEAHHGGKRHGQEFFLFWTET